jgi:transcriptional regulator with XRE-family HTH domain
MQQWHCFAGRTAAPTLDEMAQHESRRAKVTPETQEEARKLRELWDSRSHPSQAEFGEIYGIGNQSAVSQFLRGQAPLSMKAAYGFSQGLGCQIEDFSPRLAQEAAQIGGMVAGGRMLPEMAQLVAAAERLTSERWRDWTVNALRQAVKLAQEAEAMEALRETDAHQPRKRSNSL